MKKYDIIIIGCGISCLYFLKKVKEANINLKIGVIEKRPSPGGRIRSLKMGDDIIDTGALRFNDSHKLLIGLLNEYGINDIVELVSEIDIQLGTLEKKFRVFLKEVSRKKYQGFAFGEVAKTYFGEDEYEKLKLWFGYDQKWECSNCYSLAKKLLPNYASKKYYRVVNGLSQLVDNMYSELKDNFDIFLGEKVLRIADGNNIYTMSNKHFTCDHIIFACPPHYIKNIRGTEEMTPILGEVEGQILNRIYAKFKSGDWFPQKVLHSNKPISQTVPISKDVIMISYSTDRDAKYWIEQEMAGNLWTEMSNQIGVKERPLWIKQNYWHPGTHFYKPGCDPEKIQEISFRPINKNWHIIGEAYSMNQGWIEGALGNAKLFFKKFTGDKLYMGDKYYTLKEVAKHNKENDAWIVIYGKVYDVTKWITIHPGGSVINYGIGKDATEMFINAGHSPDALEFMEHYKIGSLKN